MKKSSYNIGYILFLAVVAACGGFLFGYDTAVISGTIKQVTTLFGLNDIEQGWYVGCALVGSIAGVAVALLQLLRGHGLRGTGAVQGFQRPHQRVHPGFFGIRFPVSA